MSARIPWTSPALTGLVVVSASELGKPPSSYEHSIVYDTNLTFGPS